jgi:photosynthetic reaction center cytochrome c subunit
MRRWISHCYSMTAAALFTAVVLHAAPADPKTAEQVFKNIEQLKGTPADQLLPAMQFISSSLGVECSFCHVDGKPEADDKKEKKTARSMMTMMASINKESFGGHRDVTCYSCHHGATHPVGLPPVLEGDQPAHPEAQLLMSEGLTAADVLEKFKNALGGEEAIHHITSREAKGLLVFGGNQSPIEVFTKAPNKRVSISHMGKGGSYTAFDGTSGWLGNTGRPARDMSAAESEAAGLDAEFYLALRLPQMFEQVRVGRPETVNGVECNTLIGTRPGHPPVRFYFDTKSGLLLRQIRYGETPLGRNPTQIDYADYRAVDGVKAPFRWTLSRTSGRFTIQLSEVKANVALEDDRFAKPAGEVK